MRKRFLLIFLIISLLTAVGCGNGEVIDPSNEVADKAEEVEEETVEEVEEKIGVKPYDLSPENKDLLKILNLDRDSNILSFKAPRSVKNIKANIYILDENGKWKEIDRLNSEVEDKDFYNKDFLEGTFSMVIDNVHTKKMVIKLGSTMRSLERDKDDTYIEGEIIAGSYVSLSKFLEEFREIELNKEIPLAIMVENKGEETIGYNINSFFNPELFKEIDYVQAVTLVFED